MHNVNLTLLSMQRSIGIFKKVFCYPENEMVCYTSFFIKLLTFDSHNLEAWKGLQAEQVVVLKVVEA